MADPALAPRNLQHQAHVGDRDAGVTEDPFASPALSEHTKAPSRPQPCIYPPHHHRYMPKSAAGMDANTARHERQASSSLAYKSASMSSAGESTLITPMSSMDLEKVRFEQEQEQERERTREPKRESRASSKRNSKRSPRQSRDPEKAMHSGQNSPNRAANNTSLTYEDDEDEEATEAKQKQDEKAVKILLFMAGPCVALSAINTIWALIALFITALTQPILMCAKRPTFGQQLAGLLGPTLNLQLRCIYTPLSPHANEDGSYHNFMLFVVHMLSPFVSMGVMFASWVLAVYWLCSGAVGDPAGQDKRDDGKETVLGLRNWWEKWLMKGVLEV